MARKPQDHSAFERSEEPPPSDAKDRLVQMAMQVIDAEKEVANLEDLLASANSRLNQLRDEDLPDAMAEVGYSEFKLEDGTKVSIRDLVHGNLPKEEGPRAKAIEWIERHDGASIIRTMVNAKFGREQHKAAQALALKLTKQGFDVSTDHGVHVQTLWAWVKELIRDGKPVDFDLLGVVAGRRAVITPPKSPKPKGG